MSIVKKLGSLVFLGSAMASASGKPALPGEGAPVEIQAREFRAFLEGLYDRLSNGSRINGYKVDITNEVASFFPKGMDFGEAEVFLRLAGFSIDPRPGLKQSTDPIEIQNRHVDWYAGGGSINPFRKHFPGHSSLSISLLPASPEDYSTVQRVTATIFLSTL
ncbi:hypothetical protein [Bradyrhizobium elkanii]|uniref:hypothetical protein n=1 Tax=Bradyrhizobium elkanii TaxID=29448 RepID=UPI003517D8B7